MEEDIKMLLDLTEEGMVEAINHLEKELLAIRAGKANAVMLQGVMVEYYGAMTPINQVASIMAEDGRTLRVQPFDRSSISAIERAIINSNLGLNPMNDGNLIRLNVPMLTEDRRKQLVKQARDQGESAKVSIRNSRRDANQDLKKMKDDGISEDQVKRGEAAVQELTDKYSGQVDKILEKKEAEIMTI